MELRKAFSMATLASALCAFALAMGGISVAQAATHNPPPTKAEKPTLSNMKEAAKEHAKENAKEKVAEKLGIETKQPEKPGMHQQQPPKQPPKK